MKKLIPLALGLMVMTGFALTLGFLWWKSQEPAVVFETRGPEVTDIVNKTVATGAIVPRKEVAIKSRVSGVVHGLHVEAGDLVSDGELIAEIRIIPDAASLIRAKSAVAGAQIALDEARVKLDRATRLHDNEVISEAEWDSANAEFDRLKHNFTSAQADLQVVREGAIRGSADVSTEVRSTVAGMVLELGVEEGETVTETNTFNAGTTIASVADMGDLIFEGTVDESEVGRIEEGMSLRITVGALQDEVLDGTLEYIAPKGQYDDGAVQFEIRADIEVPESLFVRAGSSANADIVVERREQVLAVDEALLLFEDGEPYVEVEVSDQVFERRDLETGVSDGIKIEILGGISEDDRLKVQDPGVSSGKWGG